MELRNLKQVFIEHIAIQTCLIICKFILYLTMTFWILIQIS